jgi:uncharacterized protein YcgI (DUF1989 family)
MSAPQIIPPRSGTAFVLHKGQSLIITDLEGEQVADLMCFNLHDTQEYLSSGRTIDYASTIFLTTGHPLYSNRSNVMMDIIEDTVGRHDFLLTPCSAEMFRIIYGDTTPHRGCFGNLIAALEPHGIQPDQIHTTFNVFMNVTVDSFSGQVKVLPPLSKPGDHIMLRATMDLLVGLTACSAGQSNNFSYKPIGYSVLG